MNIAPNGLSVVFVERSLFALEWSLDAGGLKVFAFTKR